jgi:hypothetical protein
MRVMFESSEAHRYLNMETCASTRRRPCAWRRDPKSACLGDNAARCPQGPTTSTMIPFCRRFSTQLNRKNRPGFAAIGKFGMCSGHPQRKIRPLSATRPLQAVSVFGRKSASVLEQPPETSAGAQKIAEICGREPQNHVASGDSRNSPGLERHWATQDLTWGRQNQWATASTWPPLISRRTPISRGSQLVQEDNAGEDEKTEIAKRHPDAQHDHGVQCRPAEPICAKKY